MVKLTPNITKRIYISKFPPLLYLCNFLIFLFMELTSQHIPSVPSFLPVFSMLISRLRCVACLSLFVTPLVSDLIEALGEQSVLLLLQFVRRCIFIVL